ncbi:TPA: hypothetical protein O4G91_002847 [Staphylococcus aureus]|nr:hypothetical protein [Staphylococcus aureus]HCZ9408404.1 hypothetical protein [Staphylococcus aureus]
MNTKILTGMTGSSSERKINNFINDNQIEVIDIKFSSSVFYFGVMIIYK